MFASVMCQLTVYVSLKLYGCIWSVHVSVNCIIDCVGVLWEELISSSPYLVPTQ